MSAPRSFEDLRTQISRRHAALSDRLRRIAEFAVHNPNDMALSTVAGLADRIGVQPSSIIRFANSFGYDGFSDMQKVFRSRLIADTPSYRERIAAMRSAKGRNGNATGLPTSVLSQFVGDDVAALEELHDLVSEKSLARAVAVLSQAENIFLFGQGRAFPVAYYIYYALLRLDLRGVLIDSVGGMPKVQARAAQKTDALLAISFKDYSPDVVGTVEELASRRVPVIAITDGPFSPIAVPATVSFEIPDHSERSFKSLVPPICLAQSLIVTLGYHLASRQGK